MTELSFAYADDVGVIYVIGEEGRTSPVKIGLATTPSHAHRRMLSMSTGNPRRLEIEYMKENVGHARWIEHCVHTVLQPWLVVLANSREWFDVRPIARGDWSAFIDAALAGTVAGGEPLPHAHLPSGPHHRLLYVEGVPRHLRAVCACGWSSTIGSVFKAVAAAEIHLAQPTT